MYFDSFAALVYMDGHGFYVWLAYAVASLVLLGLLLAPVIQKKRFLRDYRQSLQRRQSAPHSHSLETKV